MAGGSRGERPTSRTPEIKCFESPLPKQRFSSRPRLSVTRRGNGYVRPRCAAEIFDASLSIRRETRGSVCLFLFLFVSLTLIYIESTKAHFAFFNDTLTIFV